MTSPQIASPRQRLVLVVDDDAVARQVVAQVARSLGCEAVEVRTVAEAERLVSERTPDVIVLDGLLPDGDGLTWLRKMRAAGLKTPVLFSSAFWKDLASHRTLTDELKVAAILPKPARPDLLIRTLKEVLAQVSPAVGGTPK
jgi:DNA-binding response OmpR family regulator